MLAFKNLRKKQYIHLHIQYYKTNIKPLEEIPNFVKKEEEILEYWQQIDAFGQQLKKTKHYPPFTFYDGPPFATGLPHYGNLLAGTIKDTICRYASQNGRYVERRFGWDCHGLPIEYEIDKKLNIKTRKEVLDMGIEKYNQECRNIVMRYSKEWRHIVNRFGRWVDFDNDYKTLDIKYMESCWYVFKQLFQKGLVYRGCRIMPYSNGCATVLSNFETQQNYKEVLDPSLYICFSLKNEPDTKLVAWTTTPWTLTSNLMLGVNSKIKYAKVEDLKSGKKYILAQSRLLESIYKKSDEFVVLEVLEGKQLENLEYEPLFDYFIDRKINGCFKVLLADFVQENTGTGIVHLAPGFGEDDYKACLQKGVIKSDNPPVPVDENGFFTKEIRDFQGQSVKESEKNIRRYLKEKGVLIKDEQIKHSYPFCWRSDTPLIYKAVQCWFIKVTEIKQQLIQNNKKAYWVPKFAQEGRFNSWLENAQDWCFSRSRFWGNPIPLWVSEDGEEIVCVGSIQELKELTGKDNIQDLHRDFVDKLVIQSKLGKGTLRRIDEVFDCWFESGCMPFAQIHYPFSVNENKFQEVFPADFIAEGIDQTRGWFYTLNVISTAFKNSHPYKNLIVNGIVLAADGKKMSKSKKNYPDPLEVANRHSADAIRLYMINSPLVRAEELCFKEEGVFGVRKDVFLPWYNALKFLIQNIQRYENLNNENFIFDEIIIEEKNITNPMDKWIIISCQNLIIFVQQEMQKYHLYTVVPKLVLFLENLTNWYIRLNRNRLKNETLEQKMALNVLFSVILNSIILMAPFVPLITESFYQNLKVFLSPISVYNQNSLHFLQMPQPKNNVLDLQIEESFLRMQKIINLGRFLRESKKISLKQTVSQLKIVSKNPQFNSSINNYLQYIKEEVNVEEIIIQNDESAYIDTKVVPKHRNLGQKLQQKYTKELKEALQNLSNKQIKELQEKGKINILQNELLFEDFNVQKEIKKEFLKERNIEVDDDFVIVIDFSQNQEMKSKGIIREFCSKIQKVKKQSKIQSNMEILVSVDFGKNQNVKNEIMKNIQIVQKNINCNVILVDEQKQENLNYKNAIGSQQKFQIDQEEVIIQFFYV
ncbi:isoleucyl-tRNA synthetase, putative [Ichthyophthirius multifiliis]|uniref:isoleucine--tRNA ligase n=1 Tax=Ichthyophthirius multifiliis TaxID=5932 RepID=G0QN73_ICHMU|nr:isoleucyl-tRNA synthetase, putative [Ichthyophthirius multifiliis]EGR33327.1 isoleucyl-tRNA synthetase, putative [Ichthyophthirius multifiliis]|eukprot:XP_004037313.1 isoleucyl-tRNA synthetase, putative [Ichthyophthirius multifiliis]